MIHLYVVDIFHCLSFLLVIDLDIINKTCQNIKYSITRLNTRKGGISSHQAVTVCPLWWAGMWQKGLFVQIPHHMLADKLPLLFAFLLTCVLLTPFLSVTAPLTCLYLNFLALLMVEYLSFFPTAIYPFKLNRRYNKSQIQVSQFTSCSILFALAYSATVSVTNTVKWMEK